MGILPSKEFYQGYIYVSPMNLILTLTLQLPLILGYP